MMVGRASASMSTAPSVAISASSLWEGMASLSVPGDMALLTMAPCAVAGPLLRVGGRGARRAPSPLAAAGCLCGRRVACSTAGRGRAASAALAASGCGPGCAAPSTTSFIVASSLSYRRMRILYVPTLRMVCSGISILFFSIEKPFFSSSTATLVLFTEPNSLPFSPGGHAETDLLRLQALLEARRLQALALLALLDGRALVLQHARNSLVWGTASFLGRRKLRA